MAVASSGRPLPPVLCWLCCTVLRCAVLCCDQARWPVVGGPCFPWLIPGPATAGLHSLLCWSSSVAAFCLPMQWGALTICVLGLPGQDLTPLHFLVGPLTIHAGLLSVPLNY